MDTEWGNEFLLRFTVMYLIFLIDDVHFVSVSVQRVSVVRQSYFRLSNNSLLIFFRIKISPLLTLLLKATFHLEQRIYDFFLHGLWSSFHLILYI